jgi:superfamily II RNA helicase
MLSATIDQPERFAYWCENLHKNNKQVYLTNTTHRVVPLTHYSFITATQSVFKRIKDKTIQSEIKSVIDKPQVLQSSNGRFNDENYTKMNKVLKLFENNDIRISRPHVLNKVTEYLVQNEMLPALCFVLSRKQLEICAKEVTTNLLEFDSKVPYIIDRECEQIIRSKLSNYEEYLHLPEYVNMVSLLRKGIAIHHGGVLPVLKEIVELLYAKGYIKLLFATETFSIGVNMPTKCVLFTDVNKFDGSNIRTLYGHEYSQMSGRAGRRGIDTVGHVIHLNNLFRNVDSVSYKMMMNGKPQTLTSKFKISYNLLLNLLDIGDNNLTQFASRSMITCELDDQMKEIYYKMTTLQTELDNVNNCVSQLRTPVEVLDEYLELKKSLHSAVNKKRKEMERKIQSIIDNHRFLNQDLQSYQKISTIEKEINQLKSQYDSLQGYFQSGVGNVLELLKDESFIESSDDSTIDLKLTIQGKIASQIREIHCLAFSKLYDSKKLDHLSSKQLVALFSCFTNIRVLEDFKDNVPKSADKTVNDKVKEVLELYEDYQKKELNRNINTGFDYDIHYDLLNYVEEWCDCENVEDCKQILQKMADEKEIFLGEFVKALLKINNIASEFEKIAEMTGNIAFLSKLREIPHMTLKYVVTNQSLYV